MKRSSTRGRGKQQQNRVSKRNEKNMPACDDPWLAEAAHACHYCAKIIIKCQSGNYEHPEIADASSYKVSYAREAAAKDCRLFQHVLNERARYSKDDDHYVKFSFHADSRDIFALTSCKAEFMSTMYYWPYDDCIDNWSIGVSPSMSA